MEVNVITDQSYPDCEISSLFCRNKYIRVVDIKETEDKKILQNEFSHFTEEKFYSKNQISQLDLSQK